MGVTQKLVTAAVAFGDLMQGTFGPQGLDKMLYKTVIRMGNEKKEDACEQKCVKNVRARNARKKCPKNVQKIFEHLSKNV